MVETLSNGVTALDGAMDRLMNKGKPKPKTVVVVIEKFADKPCGLILSREPFVTDQKNYQIGVRCTNSIVPAHIFVV